MKRFLGIVILFTWCFACQNSDIKTSYYNEKHRPQFHFSPESSWMNDPNGMVFYEGEYHLFYQYYPDSTVWGPMHWGHAVSKDLVGWEHLPIALYPDSLGYIFSGSAVIDWKNTSGLGTKGKPPMIAIFTHHNVDGEKNGSNDFQYQSIAYSNDKGRTWSKYDGNPVLPNPGIKDFRDPKVIWHETTQKWIMIFAAWDHVKIYNSPNLIDWTFQSDFGREVGGHDGVWECPDLFPLKANENGEEKWVLIVSLGTGGPNGGSGTQYFIGDFDGSNFIVDESFMDNLGVVEAFISEGIIYDDFEGTQYTSLWTVEGEAFSSAPAQGTLPNQQRVTNYNNLALVNSYSEGDEETGKMISKSFKIEKQYINFLIGGGSHERKTCINLIVDGKIVRSATGQDSEKLAWSSWGCKSFFGKMATIEIIDQHQGGWGHILIDQIMFSDQEATPEQDKVVWLDYGKDNYAGVTWSDIPDEDGRRIFLGWMSNWQYAQVVPTEKWRSAMTLPRELKLIHDENGYRLQTLPVKELEGLRVSSTEMDPTLVNQEINLGISTIEIELELERAPEGLYGLQFSNDDNEVTSIFFDSGKQEYFMDRIRSGNTAFHKDFKGNHRAPVYYDSNTVKMHVFLDHSSIEVFADDGKTVITELIFPSTPYNTVKLGGNLTKNSVLSFKIHQLGKVW